MLEALKLDFIANRLLARESELSQKGMHTKSRQDDTRAYSIWCYSQGKDVLQISQILCLLFIAPQNNLDWGQTLVVV